MLTTEQRITKRMTELLERPNATVPVQKKYLIISTPRSGSSLFTDILNHSELFGECFEWFNVRYMKSYSAIVGQNEIDFNSYLQFIANKTTKNTGSFVVNMHIEQIAFLQSKKLDVFTLNFDKVIYIKRANKLEQAVSLAKARMTDQWSSSTQAVTSGNVQNSHIAKALFDLFEQEEYLQKKYKDKINHSFTYEDFSKLGTTTAFQQLAKIFNVNNIDIPKKLTREKQSNSNSNNLSHDFLQTLKGQFN